MALYWPHNLPSRWLAGVRLAPGEQVIRTPMEGGPAKVRRAHSAVATPVSVSVRMSGAEVDTFETWYEDTLLGGSLRFTARHPVTKAAAEFRFRVRPVWDEEVPSDRPETARWRATFELELMP